MNKGLRRRKKITGAVRPYFCLHYFVTAPYAVPAMGPRCAGILMSMLILNDGLFPKGNVVLDVFFGTEKGHLIV